MDKKEFEVQIKIGSLPRYAKLRYCNKCKEKTPQHVTNVVYAEDSGRTYLDWTCLICDYIQVIAMGVKSIK